MAAVNSNTSHNDIWEKTIMRAKWRSEMGAYLAMSPQVEKWDRVGISLHLHAITKLSDGYKEDHGWCNACLDMGLIQLITRLDGINKIAARYPTVVHRYKEIKQKAHKNGVTSEPKTKFIQTWKSHFRQPLLNEFTRQFNREIL